MGTARLDTERLSGLLQRLRIDCDILEGDQSLDHCVLRLSTARRAGAIAFVEYENQGEPRLVGLMVQPEDFELSSSSQHSSFEWQQTLKLEGARKDDPDKIAQWIEAEFLRA